MLIFLPPHGGATALPIEQELAQEEKLPGTNGNPLDQAIQAATRPLSLYYSGGNHGSCKALRKSLQEEFQCSPTEHF
jgi:hypothetical protein